MQYAQLTVASVKGYCQSAASAWRKPEERRRRTHGNCGPWQTRAGCSQYKSRTVVEFASGKSMHNRHSYKHEKFTS